MLLMCLPCLGGRAAHTKCPLLGLRWGPGLWALQEGEGVPPKHRSPPSRREADQRQCESSPGLPQHAQRKQTP